MKRNVKQKVHLNCNELRDVNPMHFITPQRPMRKRRSKTEEQVYLAIEEGRETPLEIADATGINENTVRSAVQRLEQKGWVYRPVTGHYRPLEGEQPPPQEDVSYRAIAAAYRAEWDEPEEDAGAVPDVGVIEIADAEGRVFLRLDVAVRRVTFIDALRVEGCVRMGE